MLRLNGAPFSVGRAKYLDHALGSTETTAKIYVEVRIAPQTLDVPALAQLDTGAAWSVMATEVAEAIDAFDEEGEEVPYASRFGRLQGKLVKLPVMLVAAEGRSLDLTATFWISRAWPGGHFIGYTGFLDAIRFAVDAQHNDFFFGPS